MWVWFTEAGIGGIYGTLGVPDPANTPGKRRDIMWWSDATGTGWMFGGRGYGATDFGSLSDLWSCNPATNEWTWKGGPSSANNTGIYGARGVPATANSPGARESGGVARMPDGTVYVFGGYGFAADTVTEGVLNDLWSLTPATASIRDWQCYN
jgi:hypothetical protein